MLQLTETQLEWLFMNTPEIKKSTKRGRPQANKRKIIQGIFWILDNGAKWKDLPALYGSKSTVHRYFQAWVRAGVFEELLKRAARRVEVDNGYKTYECFIDGAFSKARGGGDGIGPTKAGKGVKIMVMVDARGLPMAVRSCSASPHESQCVQLLFDNLMTIDILKRLIGDKAYDSDELDEQLDSRGVEMIAPHRSNRKKENKTQDGRALRRYKRRWIVERTISWIQNFRRLCIRYERTHAMFQGMLSLACCLMLTNRFLG